MSKWREAAEEQVPVIQEEEGYYVEGWYRSKRNRATRARGGDK